MANDLVVQLGAKLDQFQSDMNSAGDIADSAVSRIEQSFANLNIAGGFGTFVTSATAGLAGIIAAVVALNKNLADMQQTAEQVGLTLKDYQGVQFGGQQSGLSSDQVNSGLQQSAQLLNDASRNANSLSKIFDANGLSIKNANGQLITENQLLATAADLVSNAKTPQDAIAIAQMLGFTQEWIPLLQQGSAAMSGLSQAATEAGAVIDDATIQKATQFSAEWQKSSVIFSTELKAAIADVLPAFDDMIQRATQLANIPNLGQSIINAVGQGLTQAANDIKNTPLFTFSYNSSAPIPTKLAGLINPNSPGSYPSGADALNSSAYPQSGPKSIDEYQQQDETAFEKNIIAGSTTNVPAKDQSNDAYDRAQNQIEKYTNATNAEAEAQGQSADAMEEAKAQADLLTAAQKAGIPITQQQTDLMQDLAQDAGLAADALAKAKVNSNISFGQQTALFTPQDLQIATQLKTIFGNDVPAAMASSQAAALKFNDTIKTLGTLGQQVNEGFFTDFETQIRNGATAMQALQTAGVNALGKIADKLASMAADNLWSAAFGGASGGSILSIFGLGGATGAVNANGSIAGAVGPTSVGGAPLVGAFASGTNYAPGGLSLVGENGPEIMNVPTGAQIIPNDILRSGMGGGVSAPVSIQIDARGADAAGLANLQAQLNQMQAELPTRIVQTVTKAKKQRLLA